MSKPTLLIVAGPNGAGKSTFIENVLKINQNMDYICPYILANRLRKNNIFKNEYEIYEEAMRLAKELRYEKLKGKKDIIVETVFSSNEKIEFMKYAIKKEYNVSLIFIGTENIKINAERISKRVLMGGHSVPIEKIKPRYLKAIENLILAYKTNLCHQLFIIDNSSYVYPYKPYFYFENKNLLWVNKELDIQDFRIRKLNRNIPDWIFIVGDALVELSNKISLDETSSFSIYNYLLFLR